MSKKILIIIPILLIFIILIVILNSSKIKMEGISVEKEDYPTTLKNAITQDDISKCDGLSDIERQQCISSVITSRAISFQNPEMCNELENPQKCTDNVYLAMALSSGNKQQCDNILSEELKQYCKEAEK